MDRIAFKQRMQNLKSYRENNPGKGYWDWKVQSFAEGGENGEEVNDSPFVGPITEKQMLEQNKQMAKERMRNQFLRNEGRKAKVNPDFANYMYDFDFDRLNHEDPNERKYTLLNYWKRAREVRDEEIGKYTTPYIPEKEVVLTTGRFNTGRISTNVLDSLLASSKRTGYPFEDALGLAARESGLGYARYHRAKGKLSNTALLSNWNQVQTIYNTNNMVDKFKSIYNKYMNEQPITDKELDFIKLYIDNEDKQYDSTRPITENVWDNALKQFESGNYNPADPTYMDKVREEGRMLMQDRAIKKWAKTAKFNEGGEIGDNEKEKLYQITGRSSSGRPLEQGLNPVFNIEDLLNFTPVGDAIAANDTYQAIKQNDWLGAGLAAATMIPFVPLTVKQFRREYRGITPKAKYKSDSKLMDQMMQNRINAIDAERARRQTIIDQYSEIPTQTNNESYNIIQRLTEDPAYLNRAAEVQKQYGDDYSTIYADLIQDYDTNPNNLPKAFLDLNLEHRAQMRAKSKVQERVNKGGKVPGKGEFELAINPTNTDMSGNVTLHEMNHYTDYIKNKTPNADGNSNLFYQMSKDMDGVKVDRNDPYFRKPTEQKAYMNQLREYMYSKGMIDNRGDKVSSDLIKKALKEVEKMPAYDSTVRASKQFKSMRGYTKWFNAIPLLGSTTLAANRYFNNSNNNDIRQKK